MIRTWIELDEKAYHDNITQIRLLTDAQNLGVVLKGNAYGHGLIPIAHMAQKHDAIDMIITVAASEALELRLAGITKKILVLAHYDMPLDDLITQDIAVVCSDIGFLPLLEKAASRVGKKALVHMQIDTGMTRLGVMPGDVVYFLDYYDSCKNIEIVGCMTHLSDSENPDSAFTERQRKTFQSLVKLIKQRIPTIDYVHDCSSGSMCFAEPGSLVRVGLNQYGYWKSDIQYQRCMQKKNDAYLKPVLTWKTRIIQIKKIKECASVGYARTYTAPSGSVIAILPIGYADGYVRGLSNKGSVVINGKSAPVVGIVSMNLCAVDVTDIPSVSVGSEVTLIGDFPGSRVYDLAEKTGTINYDILTGIHVSLKRNVVNENILAEDGERKVPCISSKVILEQENQHFSK